MKQTTKLKLPYPEAGDHSQTWLWLKQLAEKLDQKLGGGTPPGEGVKSGIKKITVKKRTTYAQGQVSFTTAFRAAPHVVLSVAGGTFFLASISDPQKVTANGFPFTVRLLDPSNPNGWDAPQALQVHWLARVGGSTADADEEEDPELPLPELDPDEPVLPLPPEGDQVGGGR